MGLQKEIWQGDLKEAFYLNNNFLKYAQNKSDEVLGGRVVHIPQAGGSTDIEDIDATVPASISQRTDDELSYTLKGWRTKPRLVQKAETVEISYDKRQSVWDDMLNVISQRAGTHILGEWFKNLPADNIVRTTGSAVIGSAPGATGNRLALAETDLQTAMTRLRNTRKDLVSNIVALVPFNLMNQLFPVGNSNNTYAQTFLTDEERRSGIINKLQGFSIIPTFSRLWFDANGNLKPYGSAVVATDNEGVLCWDASSVQFALGAIDIFEQEKSPTYYGDVFSATLRAGGSRNRKDNFGVMAIVSKNN